MKEILHKEYCY